MMPLVYAFTGTGVELIGNVRSSGLSEWMTGEAVSKKMHTLLFVREVTVGELLLLMLWQFEVEMRKFSFFICKLEAAE